MIIQKNKALNIALACFVCGLVWLSMGQQLLAQTDAEPTDGSLYRATVIGENAVVRSGPGTTHYGTDRLRPGTQVVVFREDPGGWIAIRPPARSFSLVQSDEVEIYQNGLAKVIEPETVAWVGTRLKAVKKPLWQVKLRAGEMLEVLGIVDRQQYKLGSQEPDWVQIQPPKGEFRWIAASDIRPDPNNSINASDRQSGDSDIQDLQIESGSESFINTRNNAGQNQPTPFDSWEPSQGPGEWTLEVESGDSADASGMDDSFETMNTSELNSTMSAPANFPANTGWKPAKQTISNFVNERSVFHAENSNNGMYANDRNNNMGRSPGQPAINASNVRSGIFENTDNTRFGAQNVGSLSPPTLMAPSFGNNTPTLAQMSANGGLQMLEMRLTQEMIKSPAEWDLTALAGEVEQAKLNAANQRDAAFLNRLMEKIQKCREIKAGFRATGAGGPTDLETRRNTGNGTANSNQQANLLYDYDAYGVLNELVRDGGTGPTTYVLQDENGRITHHVAAPPGVNLRRYLNQRVGIIGNRGFHQTLKLDHVTAERVISIDTVRR